ncbi:DUF2798 domain-containing protein [Undibacterium sp. TC9W]|uniref:DUF2798 domain-containing protein n=1 Tax=Undibacterium sp. TC9W TaxID=3413053 RepID=UPI003BF0CF55
MQHSSAYSLAGASAQSTVVAQGQVRQTRQPRAVAGSRSLASMLPTILTTGLVSLVATAVLRLMWMGYGHDFMAAWMEAWLTVWPIAFPAAYISKPLVNKLARMLSKPVSSEAALSARGIMQASEEATAKSGLKRKPALLPVHR